MYRKVAVACQIGQRKITGMVPLVRESDGI